MRQRTRVLYASVASALVAVIAVLTLLGWIADLSTLKSVSSGLVTMKVNTACSLLMAAGSLLLQSSPRAKPSWGLAARLCALVPIAVGTLTLLEHATGMDLGLEGVQRLLSRDEPARMSRATASCLALEGAALCLLRLPRWRDAARACSLLVLLLALASGLAYAFRIAELSAAGWFQPMALHTSLALVLLASATLSTPELALTRAYRDWPMQAKMIVLLLATTLPAFLLFALLEVRAAAVQILAEQVALLSARADQLANEVDTFQLERRQLCAQLAAAAAAVGCCQEPAGSSHQMQELVAGMVSATPGLAAAVLLSGDGSVRASSTSSAPALDPQLLQQVVSRRAALSSPLHVQRLQGVEAPLLGYAAPVLRGGALTGVAVVWVSAEELWLRMRSRNGLAGEHSFAVLLDEHGIRVAHTYLQDLLFHPTGALDARTLAAAEASQRFGEHTRALLSDVQAFPEQFQRAHEAAPDRGMFRGVAPATGSFVYGVTRRLQSMPWTLFYVIPEASLQAKLLPHTRNRGWFAALFGVLSLLLGGLFASAVVRPLQHLSEATARLESEGLPARVDVQSKDELGRLAERFNAMAARISAQAQALRAANEELEQRVAQRTAELSERQHDLAITLHSIGDAVIVTDREGRVEQMNGQAERLTGWSLAEARQQPVAAVFNIADEQTGQACASPVERVLREGIVVGLANHTVLIARDGTSCPVADSAAPIFRPGGELRGVVLVFRDVGEERTVQLAIQDSERRYRELYEHQPDMCATIDPRTERIVECNEVMATRLGYSKAELLAKSMREVYSPAAIVAGEAGRVAFLRVGKISDQERSLLCKDGSVVETSLSLNTTEYAGRTLVTAVWRDISTRKQAERDQRLLLELSELQGLDSEDLLQAVSARVVEYLQAGRACFLYVERERGRVRVEYERSPRLPSLASEFPLSLLSPHVQAQQAEGRPTEIGDLPADSPLAALFGLRAVLLVPLLRDRVWTASLLVGREQRHHWQEREVMLVRGIADRAWLSAEHTRMQGELLAREKLELTRQSDQRFQALVNSVTDYAIFQLDRAGRVTTWNRGAQRIKGYAEKEVLGQPVSMFYPRSDRAAEIVDAALERARTQGRFEEEGWRVRKDGSQFWANVVITPLFDARGELEGYAKVTRDESERRRNAEALQQRQAQLTANLREREVLLQEIHHRVKNNLQVISSLLNMQMRQVHEPLTRSALEESRRRVEAIALIHEQLYQSVDFSSVQFSEYVSTLAANVFRATDVSCANIKLKIEVEPVSLAVDKAIPFGLVLNELITNTLKHGFPDQRPGTVNVELRHADPKHVLLVVTDDGVGIPPQLDLNNTPSLGMQLVTTLVKQLHGQLEVVRAPGTSFRIRIPVEVSS